MGTHHIAAMDEHGITDHPVVMKTQGVPELHPVDSGAMLETLMTHPTAMMVAITVPRLGGGRAMPAAESTARDAAARMVFMLDMVISLNKPDGELVPSMERNLGGPN